MSDNDDNGSDFQEFKGSPDPPEDGINIKDIIMTGGFVIIIVGFVLGLIRLMALQGGETPDQFASDIEQLYLSYVIMFIGMVITSVIGFGGMFKRAVTSFVSSEE